MLSKHWCRSTRHQRVDQIRQVGVNQIDTLVSIEWLLTQKIIYRYQKDARKENKTIVGYCTKHIPCLSHCIFDVELHEFYLWHVFLIILRYFCILNTFFVFCCQTIMTCDQSCRQCSWLSNFFQRADKNKLQQQGSFTQFFNVQLNWQVWFLISLCRSCQDSAQELFGPQMAMYALLHEDHWRQLERYTHEGSGREPACRLQVGPGCGRVQGLRQQRAQAVCAGRSAQRRVVWALAVFGHGPPRRQQMCTSVRRWRAPAPALVAEAEPPYWTNEPSVAQHTVHTDCTVTVIQGEIIWLCLCSIPARFLGQTRHLESITSLL